MSTLGGRIGWAARAFLAPGVEAVYGIKTCAVDGIHVASGCEPRVVEQGQHRLSLLSPGEEEGMSISLTRAALDVAWQYRRASEALERERAGLGEQELLEREEELKAVLQGVLEQLWGLEDEVLLDVSVLPAQALTLTENDGP